MSGALEHGPDCIRRMYEDAGVGVVTELSAENTMLGLEAQAEREGSAWYCFNGTFRDQRDIRDRLYVRRSGRGFTYSFYADVHAGDVVRRSTAVRLLTLAKKGLAE